MEVLAAFPRKTWIRKSKTGKAVRRRANTIKAEITAVAAGAAVDGVGAEEEVAEGLEAEAGGDRAPRKQF